MRGRPAHHIVLTGSIFLALACGDETVEPRGDYETDEPTREEVQASPPGEVVPLLKRDAAFLRTVYEPPPDLSRKDLGVVYVPDAAVPPPAPPAGRAEPQAGASGAAVPDTVPR